MFFYVHSASILLTVQSMDSTTEDRPTWLHLESNPEVMTNFLVDIGMSAEWSVVDLIGIDEELLGFVPQPVAAVIFLYPSSVHDSTEEGDSSLNETVYFMKQMIRNACGTIALLNAVGNNLDKIDLREDSPLQKYFKLVESMSATEKGRELYKNAEIRESHERHSQMGQTAIPNPDDKVGNHFVALIERNGHLYRLNGSKDGPVDHGCSSPETFLYDAAGVCREFVAKHPDCPNFTALAILKPFD